jgi:hypothetical protein
MKAYRGVDVQIQVFFTLALAGGELSTSRPGHFTTCTHWIGGWVDPRASLDPTRFQTSTPRLSSL